MDLLHPDPSWTANLALVWGLEAHGLTWDALDSSSPVPDLGRYDAVLSWWESLDRPGVGRRIARRLKHETGIEEEARRRGLPFINSIFDRVQVRHSFCLERWQEGSMPCGRFQRFGDLGEITLPWPLVLRVDGSHGARNLVLARSEDDAARIIAERRSGGLAELNLAIEFIDTVGADGRYRKRRCLVVGDRVLPRHLMQTASWKVKLEDALTDARAVEDDRRFLAEGETEGGLIRKAVQLIGLEVAAVDYTRTDDGRYVFWEGMQRFNMVGLGDDEASRRFRAATGRTKEDCRQDHLRLGEALAGLVLERIERQPG